MKFLLDTHILLWWFLNQSELLEKHRTLLLDAEQQGGEVGLSIISLWEIAKLVSANKFRMSLSLDQWFEELEDDPLIKILPLNAQIILESTRLGPNFPKDPADRLVAATARCEGLQLVTVDDRIIKSGVVAIA